MVMSWACMAGKSQQVSSDQSSVSAGRWASWLDGCDLQSQQTLVSTLTLSQKSQQTLPGPGTERADWRPAIVEFISKTCHFLCSQQINLKIKKKRNPPLRIQPYSEQDKKSEFFTLWSYTRLPVWWFVNLVQPWTKFYNLSSAAELLSWFMATLLMTHKNTEKI